MYRFAKRATDIPVSGIGAMMRYASQFPNVVSLGQGTPLFPTPSFIYDALYEKARVDETVGMYSDTKIETEKLLIDHIVAQMNKDYGFSPDPSEITLTVGGIGALYATLMALIEKGDEVVFFDPSYPLHLSQIHLTEGRPVFVPYQENGGWRFDAEGLKKAITKRTRAVILTNPNNPTGTVLSKEDVQKLATVIIDHDLILVLDEAYFFLSYSEPVYSPLRIPDLRDRTVLCRSFSKEYAMTGWRIGYAYANREVLAKIASVHIYFSVCPPTPSIIAATAAMTDPRGKQAMDEFIAKFTESKTAICERLDHLPRLFSYHPPQGAYYAFPKYLGFDMPAAEFAKKLIKEAGVVTIPGSSMGPSGAGHLRLSFAADPTVIHAAFDRFDAFAKKYKLT